MIDKDRVSAYAKHALDSYAAARVAALAATYGPRRALVGEERAYLELSERAARWTGVVGERMRGALHRALGTPIGENAVLRFGCILERPPLSVGRMTMIGHYSNIQHASIGSDCLIGDHVLMFDGRRQHGIDRVDIPINAQEGVLTQLQVGDDCMIGGRATLLADVGAHCVVAAASVVTEPVAPYAIVAGNPARVIGDRRERGGRENGDRRLADA